MKWPSTCARMSEGCQCAVSRTNGVNNTNAISRQRKHRTEEPAKDVCSKETTKPVSVKKPNAKCAPPSDFREPNRDKITYRCLKVWQGWFNQRDCHYAVKDPDHDKCLLLNWSGECKRED